jgi:hypothetical protein
MEITEAKKAWEKFYPAIPGSALRRAWCERCGEAMRITQEDAQRAAIRIEDRGSRPLCRGCDPVQTFDRYFSITERQRACLGRTRS